MLLPLNLCLGEREREREEKKEKKKKEVGNHSFRVTMFLNVCSWVISLTILYSHCGKCVNIRIHGAMLDFMIANRKDKKKKGQLTLAWSLLKRSALPSHEAPKNQGGIPSKKTNFLRRVRLFEILHEH